MNTLLSSTITQPCKCRENTKTQHSRRMPVRFFGFKLLVSINWCRNVLGLKVFLSLIKTNLWGKCWKASFKVQEFQKQSQHLPLHRHCFLRIQVFKIQHTIRLHGHVLFSIKKKRPPDYIKCTFLLVIICLEISYMALFRFMHYSTIRNLLKIYLHVSGHVVSIMHFPALFFKWIDLRRMLRNKPTTAAW